MRELSDAEFATLALGGLCEADRMRLAASVLTSIRNPARYHDLLHIAHETARHADCLERRLRAALTRDGICRPTGQPPAAGQLRPGRRATGAGGAFLIEEAK